MELQNKTNQEYHFETVHEVHFNNYKNLSLQNYTLLFGYREQTSIHDSKTRLPLVYLWDIMRDETVTLFLVNGI